MQNLLEWLSGLFDSPLSTVIVVVIVFLLFRGGQDDDGGGILSKILELLGLKTKPPAAKSAECHLCQLIDLAVTKGDGDTAKQLIDLHGKIKDL